MSKEGELRKGMTKAEIYEYFKKKKLPDWKKYDYFRKISLKANLLSPETKKGLYQAMGDTALEQGNFRDAIESYDHAGNAEALSKVGTECLSIVNKTKKRLRKQDYQKLNRGERSNYNHSLGEIQFDLEHAFEAFVKAGDFKGLNRVAALWIRVAKDLPEKGGLNYANNACKEARDNNPGVLIALGRAYERRANEFEQNKDVKREDPSHYDRTLKREFSEAIDCYERALDSHGRSLDPRSQRTRKVKERLEKLYPKVGGKQKATFE